MVAGPGSCPVGAGGLPAASSRPTWACASSGAPSQSCLLPHPYAAMVQYITHGLTEGDDDGVKSHLCSHALSLVC